MDKRRSGECIYRWRANSVIQIEEMESWFSDMAEEGYHLEEIGWFRIKFRRGEPQAVRYRIEYQSRAGTGKDWFSSPRERRDMYGQYGWEYVESYGEFEVFRSSESEGAPELYTDPAEQAYMLKSLEKKLRWMSVFVVVATIMILGLFFSVWFLNGIPVSYFVRDQTVQQLFLVAMYIYLMANSFAEARGIKRLCDRLREGRAVDHHADWRKARRKAKVVLAIILAFDIPILMLSGIALSQEFQEEYYPLPSEGVVPVVQLSQIEAGENLVRRELAIGEDWYRHNDCYTSRWGIVAPEQYESNERGEIPGRLWKDGSGVYEPSLSTEQFRLRIASLGKPLATELMTRYGRMEYLELEGGTLEERQDERFDYLMIYTNEEKVEVAAVKGKSVIYLSYYGYQPLEKILECVSEKLN